MRKSHILYLLFVFVSCNSTINNKAKINSEPGLDTVKAKGMIIIQLGHNDSIFLKLAKLNGFKIQYYINQNTSNGSTLGIHRFTDTTDSNSYFEITYDYSNYDKSISKHSSQINHLMKERDIYKYLISEKDISINNRNFHEMMYKDSSGKPDLLLLLTTITNKKSVTISFSLKDSSIRKEIQNSIVIGDMNYFNTNKKYLTLWVPTATDYTKEIYKW